MITVFSVHIEEGREKEKEGKAWEMAGKGTKKDTY
jgi:hypothetical protein